MANLSESEKQQLQSYFSQMSAAQINYQLESINNMKNWLYNDHYDFYVRVKDKLQEVWDVAKEVAKKVAKGALIVAGGAAAVAVGVALSPFYILGKILGAVD